LELAELELGAGQTEQAIQHFREAHDVAREPHTRNRLIAALLDGIRAKLPNAAQSRMSSIASAASSN